MSGHNVGDYRRSMLDIATAQARYPKAFAAIERRIADWVDELDEDPHAVPAYAELIEADGFAALQVAVLSDFLEPIAFRAPIGRRRLDS